VYKIGLIKTILMDLRGEENITTEQHDRYDIMVQKANGRKKKTPFIGVPYNVGSTTHRASAKKKDINKLNYSFGCPRIFMRFSCTSAINQVPFAFVDWVKFTATKFDRTTFKGKMTRAEWESGPRTRPGSHVNPFVPCDHFIPSRFLLAYETNLDVAFIGIDPERIGETIIDDAMSTDLGDNVLKYLGGDTGEENNIPANLHKFLTTDFQYIPNACM
jgi:hypothetical protein